VLVGLQSSHKIIELDLTLIQALDASPHSRPRSSSRNKKLRLRTILSKRSRLRKAAALLFPSTDLTLCYNSLLILALLKCFMASWQEMIEKTRIHRFVREMRTRKSKPRKNKNMSDTSFQSGICFSSNRYFFASLIFTVILIQSSSFSQLISSHSSTQLHQPNPKSNRTQQNPKPIPPQ